MTKASLTAVALAGVCRPQRGSSIAAGGDVNNDAERDVVVSQRPPGDDAVYRLWSSFSRDPVVPQRDPDDTAPGPKELVIVPGADHNELALVTGDTLRDAVGRFH